MPKNYSGKRSNAGIGKIWKDKVVSLEMKTRIVKVIIIPVVLCGCEAWTKTKAQEKKIEACEMWIWWRMLRASWTEKRTNEHILEDIEHLRRDMT